MRKFFLILVVVLSFPNSVISVFILFFLFGLKDSTLAKLPHFEPFDDQKYVAI